MRPSSVLAGHRSLREVSVTNVQLTQAKGSGMIVEEGRNGGKVLLGGRAACDLPARARSALCGGPPVLCEISPRVILHSTNAATVVEIGIPT